MTESQYFAPTDASSAVLVTGAAGGLGIHVVRVLSEAGWKVRAFDRRELSQTRRGCLAEDLDDVEWIVGRGAGDELCSALAGCRALVHTASICSLSAPESELTKINHDLTEILFRRSAELGVDHFVHISCASVYQTETGVQIEESPTEAYNAYEQSKLDAEDTLRKLKTQLADAPELTVLRPGLLYGPGCTSMGSGLIPLPAILRGVSRYLPGLTGGPRTNWCHVSDVASAVEVVLRHKDGRGRIFNVADETALSFGEVLTSIIEGYGIDLGPSVRMPRIAMWTLLGPLLDTSWSLVRMRSLLQFLWRRIQAGHGLDSPLRPRLNRDALFYIRDDAIVVADALRALGWSPEWPDYRQGIAATIRWYQEQGWAPRFDLDALAERRDAAPSSSHFSYRERVDGTLVGDDRTRPAQLELTLSWPGLPIPPTRREGRLEGTLSISDLVEEAEIKGTIYLRWLPVMEFVYEFGFRDAEGRACRFRGTRRLQPTTPVDSLLGLQGTVFNERGECLGKFDGRSADGVLPLLTATSSSDSS